MEALQGGSAPLLEVRDLKVAFQTEDGPVVAVDGVSFDVWPSEIVGVVGESGCGKSVSALAAAGLIRARGGRVTSGTVRFAGQDMLGLPPRELRKLRGKEIALIFQEPMASFDPMYTIGSQLEEAISAHLAMAPADRRDRILRLFQRVGIPTPQERLRALPRQLSGGMAQRAMIAMALLLKPKLLIADEPTTALDVTIQAQVLRLLRDLQQEYGMAVMLITHNLGVVAQVADRVVVMYAGQVVESAPVHGLFARPAHPYTGALLDSLPRPDEDREVLLIIPGDVPVPGRWPSGCRFHPRCALADDRCRTEAPALTQLDENHQVRCWQPQNQTKPGDES